MGEQTCREQYLKELVPKKSPYIGTLYFAHTGNHYMALKKISREVNNNCSLVLARTLNQWIAIYLLKVDNKIDRKKKKGFSLCIISKFISRAYGPYFNYNYCNEIKIIYDYLVHFIVHLVEKKIECWMFEEFHQGVWFIKVTLIYISTNRQFN